MEILENEKNMTIIKNDGNYYLFSYNSKIAIFYNCEKSPWLRLTNKWDYSQATLKHLKHFINNYTIYEYNTKKDFEKLMAKTQKDFNSLGTGKLIYIENVKF